MLGRHWNVTESKEKVGIQAPGRVGSSLSLQGPRSSCPRALVLMSLHGTENSDGTSPCSTKNAFPHLTRSLGGGRPWGVSEAVHCCQASGFSHLSTRPTSVAGFITSSLPPSLLVSRWLPHEDRATLTREGDRSFPVISFVLASQELAPSPPPGLTGLKWTARSSLSQWPVA